MSPPASVRPIPAAVPPPTPPVEPDDDDDAIDLLPSLDEADEAPLSTPGEADEVELASLGDPFDDEANEDSALDEPVDEVADELVVEAKVVRDRRKRGGAREADDESSSSMDLGDDGLTDFSGSDAADDERPSAAEDLLDTFDDEKLDDGGEEGPLEEEPPLGELPPIDSDEEDLPLEEDDQDRKEIGLH